MIYFLFSLLKENIAKKEQIRHIWFEKTTPPITVTAEPMQWLAALFLTMSEYNLYALLSNFPSDVFFYKLC